MKLRAVMFLLFVGLFCAPSFAAGNHWIRVKDSYRLHRYFVNHYGNVIGGYYVPPKPTWQAVELPIAYTAQCDEGKPTEFASEEAARGFVEACR